MPSFHLKLVGLQRGQKALWSSIRLPGIQQQLSAQGRSGTDRHRYHVSMTVHEGVSRPAEDLDNYYKPIIDTITYCKLLWEDDKQIDEMRVVRTKVAGRDTTVDVEIDQVPPLTPPAP